MRCIAHDRAVRSRAGDHPAPPRFSTTARVALAIAVFAALAVPTGPAEASTTVKGKVAGAKGFTVIGVPKSGSGVSRRLGSTGAFKLSFKGRSARGATLHLVRPSGTYYGPVRLRRSGRRAYLRLSGVSGSVGPLRLRGGYAAGRTGVAARLVDRRLRTKATAAGKPVGAGRLGLVGSVRASAAGSQPPPPGDGPPPPGDEPAPLLPLQGDAALGADPDADGLTNNFDVDDNGNGLLDASDPATGPPQNQPAWIAVNLKVSLEDSLNVNGAPVTREQIDALLVEHLWPSFAVNPERVGLSGTTAVNVDCFRLRYCRRGDGTATIFEQPRPTEPPGGSRWIDYDPDGDGLPNLAKNTRLPGEAWDIGVRSRVPSSDISPADTINFLPRTGAGETTISTTMGAYFVTTPGIHTYDDGSGPKAVSYPPKPGDPGTSGGRNDIQLQSERVTLTFWRPQRPAIPGAEGGDYVDMGKLHYTVFAPNGPPSGCKAEDYSNLSPTLRLDSDGYYDILSDTAEDAPPDSGNLLSVTVDLGQCLRRAGIPTEQCGSLGLEARTDAANNAAQGMWVRMPGASCQGPGPPPPAGAPGEG